jgi:hypothetical protein
MRSWQAEWPLARRRAMPFCLEVSYSLALRSQTDKIQGFPVFGSSVVRPPREPLTSARLAARSEAGKRASTQQNSRRASLARSLTNVVVLADPG